MSRKTAFLKTFSPWYKFMLNEYTTTIAIFAALCAIAFILSGCASLPTPCEPATVQVPVPVSCVTSVPDRPSWALDILSEKPTDFEKIQALTIDWAQQRQYINGLEAVVEGCR